MLDSAEFELQTSGTTHTPPITIQLILLQI